MRKTKPSLYQVHVEDTSTGKEIPVGPKMMLPQTEAFCEAINVMIGRALEKTWSNPTIVEIAQEDSGESSVTIGDLLKRN